MNCTKYFRAANLAFVISPSGVAEALVIGSTVPATTVSLTGDVSGEA